MNGHFKWIASALATLVMALAMYQLKEVVDSLKTIHVQHAVMAERLTTLETTLKLHMREEQP